MTGKARSSRSSSNPSYFVVGRVGRAVGLRGEVEVTVESDEPARFESGSQLLTAGDLRRLTIRTVREGKGRLIVSFHQFTDRTQAEALRGTELVIPATESRSLDEGEYWDHDLIGCVVFTLSGEEVGRVTEVLHAPANDVLVVQGKAEHLVPLIRDVVVSVQPGVRIEIDPIPGLLD